MNTPMHPTDPQIHRLLGDEETAKLVERGFIAPVPTEDHPLAKELFVKFKPGSDILTKPKAYEIANELNRLKRENATLSANMDVMVSELATLAGAAMEGVATLDGVRREIKSGIESLSKLP